MRLSTGKAGRWWASTYYGWRVAAAGAAITSVSSLYFYGFTVFFLPVAADLGLSRAATSLIFTLARLEGGLLAPLMGWLIDKMGPRRLIVAGALLAGLGFLLLSRVPSFGVFLLVYLALIAPGFGMGFFQAMIAAVNLWFTRHRTIAMSVLTSSYRFGGAFLTPLVSLLVVNYGWRTGAVFAGLLLMAVALPASLVVRRSPESMGLLPEGVEPAQGGRGEGDKREPEGATVREALRTPLFWLMALGNTTGFLVFTGMTVHLVPIFVWKGLSQQSAANLVGLVAFLGIPLGLGIGWLGDRWYKALLVAGGNLLRVVALLLLIYAHQAWAFYLFTLIFALGTGVGAVNWSLLGDLFGRRSFATLRGIINAVSSVGLAAPVLAGWAYDNTHSYTPALAGFAVAAGTGFLVFLVVHQAVQRRTAALLPRP